MPMSEASLEGIKTNGHRWQYRLVLGDLPQQIGALNTRKNEGGEEPTRAELEPIVDQIVKHLRAFAERRYARTDREDIIGNRIDACADELEMVSDCEIDDINHAMGELYDTCDFWRILIN